MVQIELTNEETEMLREILLSHLSGLRMEIAYTDRKEFREFLRKRREFMEGFIQTLERELIAGGKEMININRLRSVKILHGLTDWELLGIAHFFHEENAPEAMTLCEEGQRADRLFVLEQGAVSIRSQKGEIYTIGTLGEMFGWSFLVPPNRYTATAKTSAPTKLLVIKSPDFYYLIHKEPKMGVKIMDNLAQVVATRLKGLEA